MSKEFIDLNGRKIANLLFHIEHNGEIIGDKRTLDNVQDSLKIMLRDHEALLGKKFR
ncbi:hypothetical protein [Heyndrickxia camelliae]|uniref:hypothetical protein n=1 Tax=Heyndrickxia camelliae TaxID=1707093 RepID=UPI0013FD1B53|nr:hypothetical protein [Heyndrickxia camelliae]